MIAAREGIAVAERYIKLAECEDEFAVSILDTYIGRAGKPHRSTTDVMECGKSFPSFCLAGTPFWAGNMKTGCL
jgi:hypothetical protein